MDYVYAFTNENVTSFNSLYNFSNAKVLSVLGSGDQYFSSLLYGASDIELYDVNSLAWDYFVLKNYGIMIFNYEEFYDYFIIKRLDDINYFRRLERYLPSDIANRLNNLHKKYNGLSQFLFTIIDDEIYRSGDIIPYFEREKYYKLQSILLSRSLPTFHLTHLAKLPDRIVNKNYDIILTSNVFDWMYLHNEKENVKVYKELLNRFNYSEIQALYSWDLPEDLRAEFERNGFDIEQVPGVKKNAVIE